MIKRTRYLLQEHERKAYRRLMAKAFEAADQFKGREKEEQKLLSSLILVEEFVRARNSGRPDVVLEAQFSQQAGFNQHNNTEDLLSHAISRAWGMLSRLEGMDEQLQALVTMGALVDRSELIYVLADKKLPGGDGAGPIEPDEFKKQPRLSTLVKQLQTIGVYTDDIIIRVGRVFEHGMRRLPYYLVEIPRLGKQIAICDQYGQNTFVSQDIMHPHIWASKTKSELKEMPHITPVPFGMKWANKVCNLLQYGCEDMTPPKGSVSHVGDKVDIQKYERGRAKKTNNKSPLTVPLIVDSSVIQFEKTGRWPATTLGEQGVFLGGALKDERFDTVSSIIRQRLRGLDKENIPDEVRGLITMLEWQGLTTSNFSPTKNIAVKDIVDSSIAHREITGEWPHESEKFVAGTLKGWKCRIISGLIRTRGRGLDKENIPDDVLSLGQLLEWKKLKDPKQNLTVKAIVESSKAHYKKTRKWPAKDKANSSFEAGSLKGMKTSSLHATITHRLRGLDKENIPEEVNGLTDLLEWQGVTDIKVSEIVSSSLAHKELTGKWPTAAGSFKAGSLEGQKCSTIGHYIRNREKGLAKENIPDEVQSIAGILVWKGVKEPTPMYSNVPIEPRF